MPNRLVLWKGYCFSEAVNPSNHDLLQIERLLNGELSTVNYEHIQGIDVQSIRSTIKRRIIFSNVTVNNQHLAKIEAILTNHEYKKYIRRVMAQKTPTILDMKDLTIITADDIDEIEVRNDEFHITIPKEKAFSLTRYNQSILLLNDDQTLAANPLNLPCLLEGAAGSGKTLTFFSMLNQMIASLVEKNIEIDRDILVTSSKPTLNAALKEQWYANTNPLSQTQPGQRVIFLSEDEIYARYSPMAQNNKTALSTQAFLTLIKESINKHFKKEIIETLKIDDTALLHEFEIMAVTKDLETYLKLGERESYLSTSALRHEREPLWRCFETVASIIAESPHYSPHISNFETAITFYAAFHDEVQTGYLPAKFIIRKMVENGRYLLCGHSAQGTEKEMSDISTFVRCLGVNDRPLNKHILTKTYRNPASIFLFGEFINRLRRYIAGGAIDKSERDLLSESLSANKKGGLSFIPTKDLQPHLQNYPANNPNTIIITEEKYIDEAMNVFGTGYVGTVKEFGGQERAYVYLYKMTECLDAVNVNALLKNFDPAAKDNVNLPKIAKVNYNFNPFFARLYTAVTRGQKFVYFIEDNTPNNIHKRKFLFHHLVNQIKAINIQRPNIEPVIEEKTETDEKEWLTVIDQLFTDKNIAAAARIWTVNLKRNINEFNQKYGIHTQTTPAASTKKTNIPLAGKGKKTQKGSPAKKTPPVREIVPTVDPINELVQLLCRDKAEFKRVIDNNPERLLSLTVSDWLKQYTTPALYRENKTSYHLLALVLLELCDETIPPFMINVFSQNQYNLFKQIEFKQLTVTDIYTRYSLDPFCIIDLFLHNKHASPKHIKLVEYLLRIQSKNPDIQRISMFSKILIFRLHRASNKPLADLFSINPTHAEAGAIVIENAFKHPSSLTVFNTPSSPVSIIADKLLTQNWFYQNLVEYCDRFNKTRKESQRQTAENIFRFFKNLNYSREVVIGNTTVPLIFYLLNNPRRRALTSKLINILGITLFEKTPKENIAFADVLFKPYPLTSKSASTHTSEPVVTTAIDLLFTGPTRLIATEMIISLNYLFKKCIAQTGFLFNTLVRVGETDVRLLALFYKNTFTPEQKNAFNIIVKMDNYVLLKHAPLSFIMQIADDIPKRRFGHLLISDENFDFIQHYYLKSDKRISKDNFALTLIAFLFYTKTVTSLGRINTFIALARHEKHHRMLMNAIEWLVNYDNTVIDIIAECLSADLRPDIEMKYYVWNGLATLLSFSYRRQFLVFLLTRFPTLLDAIPTVAWSHASNPDCLLRALYATTEGKCALERLADSHKDLYRRATGTNPVDISLIDEQLLLLVADYDPLSIDDFKNLILTDKFINPIKEQISKEGVEVLFKRRDFFKVAFLAYRDSEFGLYQLADTLLSNQNHARAFLDHFKQRPELITALFHYIPLSLPINMKTHIKSFDSFLTLPQLYQLLEMLFIDSPEYALYTKEIFNFDILLESMSSKNYPYLSGLATHAPKLLLQIAKFVPAVLTDIPLQIWLPIDKNYYTTPISDVLTETPENTIILLSLMALHQFAFLNRLSLETLIEVKDITTSLFNFILVIDTYGIIHQYLNDQLSKLPTAEKLALVCQPNTGRHDKSDVTNLFYFTQSAILMISIIQLLNDLDDEATKKTFVDALCAYTYNDHTKQWSPSPLSNLVHNTEFGIGILFAILNAHPDIAEMIPARAWSSHEDENDYRLLTILRENTVVPEITKLITMTKNTIASPSNTGLFSQHNNIPHHEKESASCLIPKNHQ